MLDGYLVLSVIHFTSFFSFYYKTDFVELFCEVNSMVFNMPLYACTPATVYLDEFEKSCQLPGVDG